MNVDLVMPVELAAACVFAVIGLPLTALVVVGAPALVARPLSERRTAAVVETTFILSVVGALVAAIAFVRSGAEDIPVEWTTLFEVPGYTFDLSFYVDRLSITMLLLSIGVTGLIGRLSITYLHKEPGFTRFFVLLLLFSLAMRILVMAGSLDFLFFGWELVGLSSTLLIAFFHERKETVRRALAAYLTYRTCDLGLLFGAAWLAHEAGDASFARMFGPGRWPFAAAAIDSLPATLVVLLLFIAACGKSAQFPVSGWLPRAMEGPTPSSALFYGALSVHAGVYLMLRVSPLLDAAPLARVVVGIIGLLTALHATLAGRVQADAKNSLAYATITQVGIIFVEIALGLYTLALLHMVGHVLLRTLQFLRAPNVIEDAKRRRNMAGGTLSTGDYLEKMLPPSVRLPLYAWSIERFHLDTILIRFVVDPMLRLSRHLARFEAIIEKVVAGRSA
ncbi:MAG: proton-conducting membrane transporter [Deltaproteobacteria bacterium]|nr:proton-conducting membrane transporter [Deltaproteobacteria bacterium]